MLLTAGRPCGPCRRFRKAMYLRTGALFIALFEIVIIFSNKKKFEHWTLPSFLLNLSILLRYLFDICMAVCGLYRSRLKCWDPDCKSLGIADSCEAVLAGFSMSLAKCLLRHVHYPRWNPPHCTYKGQHLPFALKLPSRFLQISREDSNKVFENMGNIMYWKES